MGMGCPFRRMKMFWKQTEMMFSTLNVENATELYALQ